jgi:hypothetical protein
MTIRDHLRVPLYVINWRHHEAAHCPQCNVSLDAPMPDAG